MLGEHRRAPPGAAAASDEASELRICVNIAGLNRAASQERLWPSRIGRYEGPPQSYVRMPLGLPNAAATFQHHLRSVLAAQEARHQAVLAEMATALREPPEHLEPPEVQDPGVS